MSASTQTETQVRVRMAFDTEVLATTTALPFKETLASGAAERNKSSKASARAFSTTTTTATLTDGPPQELLRDWSVEITPGAAKKISSFSDLAHLPAGTRVNVTYLVGADIDDSVSTCTRLAEAGMRPVAHVPARAFAHLGEVETYLRRLRAVGVDELLLIGGGQTTPVGELSETLQVLESGLVRGLGFGRVGLAAHPEGHPVVPEAELMDAMVRKLRARDGVETYLETQFCFEAGAVVDWEARVRRALDEADVTYRPQIQLGVAGPAKMSNLIRFGVMSGVGASLSFLTRHTGDVLKLASTADPGRLIADVAQHRAATPDSLIHGLHFYPFGGFKKTLDWIRLAETGGVQW